MISVLYFQTDKTKNAPISMFLVKYMCTHKNFPEEHQQRLEGKVGRRLPSTGYPPITEHPLTLSEYLIICRHYSFKGQN